MSFLDEVESALPALRRYAVALVRDREAADDLVQDCVERALGRRALWRGTGPVRAWMFRILINLHRDALRKGPARARLVAVEDAGGIAMPGGQEGHMALKETAEAIRRLPPDQREALLLVALEGLRLAEAADLLGIPQGTLVSRLGRARAALRQMTGRGTHAPTGRRDASG